MTKVVYNSCYGGFGLSDEAIARYLEIKGIASFPEAGHWGSTFWLSPPTGDKKTDNQREAFWYWDLKRDDPVLIQVIEELGNKANGMCADLVVEDLPAGTRYRIEEYDGLEHIEYAEDVDWNVA